MIRRILPAAFAIVAVAGFAGGDAFAQSAASKATPPAAIPRVSLNNVARIGYFYAGGQYEGQIGELKEPTMGGAMYFEVMVPKQIKSPYPIVFLHGAGQTGVDWLQTPDGRPGWAYNFLDMGYVVYLEDFPARGRSQYVPGVDGTNENLNLNIRTANNISDIFTNNKGDYPRAKLHTQWPGTGAIGDKIFDDFNKTQVQFLGGNKQELMVRDANVALLDMIGTPVILLTHSQGGNFGWTIADRRPNLVRAVVTVEPGGPPIKNVDTAKVAYNANGGGMAWGITGSPIAYEPAIKDPSELQTVLETTTPEQGTVPCYVQKEPARKLANLQKIPVLDISGEGGYHRVFDRCVATWLKQAGVKTDYVELENVGIKGNGHMMMLEKNSADIAKYMGQWLAKNATASGTPASKAMPPAAIPTFASDSIGARGVFYAGGSYVGEPGKQIMHGSMYTEVWVPKQIKSPYPMVIFHGNGQTGQDWLYTPDGRKGWAYYLMDAGYVVYMVDYPARGRSAYVPLKTADGKWIDGDFGIRTGLELARIWTAGRELGDFPLHMNHTQWPGSGKPGDPIFDNFIRTQVQFAGESTRMAVPAGIALLDMINTPIVLMTHSQGGGVSFEVTEQRPKLIHAMVAIEPGGPQFGGVNTSTAEAGPRNARSWGLTTTPYEYSPAANSPADLKVHLEDKSDRPGEARCWMQDEPARKLVRWQTFKVLSISAAGTYHRTYDPCIPKFLKQAGVDDTFVRLEDVGINGNSHMMMLEKNSDVVIKFITDWLQKNVLNSSTTATR